MVKFASYKPTNQSQHLRFPLLLFIKERIYLDHKLKNCLFLEKVINTDDSVNPLSPNILFLYSLKASEKVWFSEVFRKHGFLKFSEGIKGENWVGMTISDDRAFHPKSVETKIFSTGFVSTRGLKLTVRRCRKDSSTFEKD